MFTTLFTIWYPVLYIRIRAQLKPRLGLFREDRKRELQETENKDEPLRWRRPTAARRPAPRGRSLYEPVAGGTTTITATTTVMRAVVRGENYGEPSASAKTSILYRGCQARACAAHWVPYFVYNPVREEALRGSAQRMTNT